MNIPSRFRAWRALGVAFFACLPLTLQAANPAILVQGGQKIGFMGDSITAQGNAPDGYINLVIVGLRAEGIEATPIPAGVPGHTSGNMRGRVEPQILKPGANWMTLSCGVNDVMLQRKGKGVDLENYKKNVTAMVEMATAQKVKVVLMTPTPLGEDLDSEENRQMGTYVDFLRSYANENKLVLADINAAFRDYLKTAPAPGEIPGKRLLADGIHPNSTGQNLMAKTLITALGVPAGDLPKIEKAWFENPLGKGIKLPEGGVACVSPKQYQALVKIANNRPVAVARLVAPLWASAMQDSPQGGNTASDPEKQKIAAQARFGLLVDQFITQSALSR